MPVSQALKQRLVQQFQQKQQTETLAAQASRAAAHSDDQPHSSGTKGPAVVQPIQHPAEVTAPPPRSSPPPASLPPERSIKLEQRREPPAKAQFHAPAPSKLQTQTHLGKREREHATPREHAVDSNSHKEKPPPPQHDPRISEQTTQEPALPRAKSASGMPSSQVVYPKFKKTENVATTPLDILHGSEEKPRPMGHVAARSCASYSELWTAVRRVCGEQINRTTARLCYQDGEDDWIALLPDVPFTRFSHSVKRLLVVCPKKQMTDK